MPRYPRVFLQAHPHHVVQRGHDRGAVFACDRDYQVYLDNLAEQQQLRDVRVHAYCLMTNHVHLLLEPATDDGAISALMRVVAARQTRYVNRLERRSGTLWEGRFKCSLVQREAYLAACIRYIEMNPVKAGMVPSADRYPWSSCGQRAGLTTSGIQLVDPPPGLDGGARPNGGGDDETDALIRTALERNQLTGNARFRREIEAKLGRRISNKPPGRPPSKPAGPGR